MTVKELIAKLAALPNQEASVMLNNGDTSELLLAREVTALEVRQTTWQPDLFLPASGPHADPAASTGPKVLAAYIG